VCNTGDVGGRRRHKRAAAAEEISLTCSKPETSQTAAPPSKKSRKDDDIEELAAASNLSKEERQTLYEAMVRSFPQPTTVTRSTLEGWMPGISPENITHLLLRRNQEAANAMCRRMEKGARARQQKILDSFSK